MNKQRTVTEFVQALQETQPDMSLIINRARTCVAGVIPGTSERIMYGGIMFTRDGEDFGGIFPYAQHVSFEFSKGVHLDDLKNQLEGKGKSRRHLKFYAVDDIEAKDLGSYLKQYK